MKTKLVSVLPKCDICGSPAVYDSPTKQGPWANMCETCYNRHKTGIGTKFKLRIPSDDNKDNKVLAAKLITSLEDMIFDPIVEWKCPSCGEINSLEPDASGVVVCDGCNQKMLIRNPLFWG